jgi:hypothetical protein
MADADALLIRKLNVAALEGGNAHTDLEKAFGTRPVISFRYLAEEMATGIMIGVSPTMLGRPAATGDDRARRPGALGRAPVEAVQRSGRQ